MLLVSSRGGLEVIEGHPMGDGVRLCGRLAENEEVVFVFREIGKLKHPFCSVKDLIEGLCLSLFVFLFFRHF